MSTQPTTNSRRAAFAVLLVQVLGGAVFGLGTMVVILPGVLGDNIRQFNHVTAAVVTLFSFVSLIGNVLGFLELAIRGGTVDRKRFLLQRSFFAVPLLLALPFMGDDIWLRLVIMGVVSWLLPFEAAVRPYLTATLAYPDGKLNANLTTVFLLSLAFDRIPFIWVTDLTGNPWYGMAASGVAVLLMTPLIWKFMPVDQPDSGAERLNLKELVNEVRVPRLRWASLLGGVSGAGTGLLDATNALFLKDYGWESMKTVYGFTSLVAAATLLVYPRFQARRPRGSLILTNSLMLVGYLILLLSAIVGGHHSLVFLALLGLGACIVYVMTNWGIVNLITAESTTSTAIWVLGRVLGIAAAAQLGGLAYAVAGYPAAILTGMLIAFLGLVLLPRGIRQMGLRYGEPVVEGTMRVRDVITLAMSGTITLGGVSHPLNQSMIRVTNGATDVLVVRDLPASRWRSLWRELLAFGRQSDGQGYRRYVIQYAPGRFALIMAMRGVALDVRGGNIRILSIRARGVAVDQLTWSRSEDTSQPNAALARLTRNLPTLRSQWVQRRMQVAVASVGAFTLLAFLTHSAALASLAALALAYAVTVAGARSLERGSVLPRHLVGIYTALSGLIVGCVAVLLGVVQSLGGGQLDGLLGTVIAVALVVGTAVSLIQHVRARLWEIRLAESCWQEGLSIAGKRLAAPPQITMVRLTGEVPTERPVVTFTFTSTSNMMAIDADQPLLERAVHGLAPGARVAFEREDGGGGVRPLPRS